MFALVVSSLLAGDGLSERVREHTPVRHDVLFAMAMRALRPVARNQSARVLSRPRDAQPPCTSLIACRTTRCWRGVLICASRAARRCVLEGVCTTSARRALLVRMQHAWQQRVDRPSAAVVGIRPLKNQRRLPNDGNCARLNRARCRDTRCFFPTAVLLVPLHWNFVGAFWRTSARLRIRPCCLCTPPSLLLLAPRHRRCRQCEPVVGSALARTKSEWWQNRLLWKRTLGLGDTSSSRKPLSFRKRSFGPPLRRNEFQPGSGGL